MQHNKQAMAFEEKPTLVLDRNFTHRVLEEQVEEEYIELVEKDIEFLD